MTRTDATNARDRPLRPWLAALIGVAAQVVFSAILDQFGGDRDPNARGGTQALVLLLSTGLGAIAAARLSKRTTPAWIVGAVGLAAAVAYLFIELQGGRAVPLWVAVSTLGAPLLGARAGEIALR